MTIDLSLEPAIQQVTVGGTGTWTDFEHLVRRRRDDMS
jgi:hypothetical protein